MTRKIVFDTGPIISMALIGLLRFLEPLKKSFGGEFILTPAVRRELIDRPLEIRRFAFEALRVLRYIRTGVLTIADSAAVSSEATKLMDIVNRIFQAKGQWMKVFHYAEIEVIAYAILNKADAIVIDERTTRMLLENPEGLEVRLSKKLHTKIVVNSQNMEEFKRRTHGIKVLRSVELAAAAYELGMLKEYMPDHVPKEKSELMLLDAILWGLKLNGCAISEDEMTRIKRMLKEPPETI